MTAQETRDILNKGNDQDSQYYINLLLAKVKEAVANRKDYVIFTSNYIISEREALNKAYNYLRKIGYVVLDGHDSDGFEYTTIKF